MTKFDLFASTAKKLDANQCKNVIGGQKQYQCTYYTGMGLTRTATRSVTYSANELAGATADAWKDREPGETQVMCGLGIW